MQQNSCSSPLAGFCAYADSYSEERLFVGRRTCWLHSGWWVNSDVTRATPWPEIWSPQAVVNHCPVRMNYTTTAPLCPKKADVQESAIPHLDHDAGIPYPSSSWPEARAAQSACIFSCPVNNRTVRGREQAAERLVDVGRVTPENDHLRPCIIRFVWLEKMGWLSAYNTPQRTTSACSHRSST